MQNLADMNINEMMNGTTLLVVSPAELKEFALTLADEVSKARAEENKLFTPEQFAQLHGVNVSTLWRWRKAGILKATQIGGRVFFKESDLTKEHA